MTAVQRPLALLLLVLLLTAGCSRADQPVRSTDGGGYVGASKSLTRVPPAERLTAPVASGPLLGSEKTVSTADYAGHVVVLNVWASWCAPCRQEAPELQAASVATTKKARFLGINSRDPDPAPAEAFVRAQKITYPSVYDPQGAMLLNFHGTLPLTSFPSTLVLDQQGRIAARITGAITKITLVDLVDDIAAGK